MSKKLKKTSGRRPSVRRPKKQQSNAVLPIAIGGLSVLLVIIVAVMAGSGSPSKPVVKNNTTTETDKVEVAKKETAVQPEDKAVQVLKKTAPVAKVNPVETQKTKTAKIEAAEVKVDNRSLQEIQIEARQMALEKKFDEAIAMIDKYDGPHNLTLLRREVELKHEDFKTYGDRNQQVAEVQEQQAPINRTVAAKPEPKKPLKPLGNNARGDRGPNGFLYETEADRKKIKKAPSVNLVVHSQIVGLPKDVIVVWKDRTLVLSYSRLIKNCENKKSKYYAERVEKAKKFLEEHRGEYELIPYAKAKMTLRSKGFTVSEVFFNQSVKIEQDYTASTKTDRYKGYIISYDIKPPSMGGGFGMGC